MNHNEGDDKRMAIKGLGMDAVELSRIEKIVVEPKSFLEKVLTPKELEKYNEKIRRINKKEHKWSKTMRHVFIVNKFSLNKRLDTISEKIKEVCQELQIDYVIETISKDNLMKDALKKYLDTQNIIIAVRRRRNNK